MARSRQLPGEKPLFWIGSAKHDLLEFPEPVRDEVGVALSVAQFGGKHSKAKPWKGEGAGVLEIAEDYRGNTYRAVYTVKFEKAAYVLHAFQKKSPKGIKDSQNGRGIGFTEAEGSQRGLRGAIWRTEITERLLFRVRATCSLILV